MIDIVLSLPQAIALPEKKPLFHPTLQVFGSKVTLHLGHVAFFSISSENSSISALQAGQATLTAFNDLLLSKPGQC
jgi:hypothetical protein